MRRSPWLPILILVALGLYVAPRESGQPFEYNFDFNPIPRLQEPAQLPDDVRDLFRKSRPATVRVEQVSNSYGAIEAVGTGFFIDNKGTLLTAYHVVEGAKFLNVTTQSRQRFRAQVVGFDAARDIAVVKADVRGTVPFLTLAERAPRIGERVLAIGNSREQFLQPRRGRLLRLNAEAARADFPQGTLEMSAPLAPGDSGGPIIDSGGKAIGVVSYIRLASDDIGALTSPHDVKTLASYAVPVTTVDETVLALRRGEKRDVPALGIMGDEGQHLNVPGAVISRVVPGSPAAKAGLQGLQTVPRRDANGRAVRDAQGNPVRDLQADVIVAVDDQPTGSFNELLFQIRQKQVGDTVVLTVDRSGKRLKLPVKLGAKGNINYYQNE